MSHTGSRLILLLFNRYFVIFAKQNTLLTINLKMKKSTYLRSGIIFVIKSSQKHIETLSFILIFENIPDFFVIVYELVLVI